MWGNWSRANNEHDESVSKEGHYQQASSSVIEEFRNIRGHTSRTEM